MKVAYCQHCGKETTFKRRLGFGSYLGLLITLGLWSIAISQYAVRCTECGAKEPRFMTRDDRLSIPRG